MSTSKAAASPKGVTKTASLLPSAQLGTNKGDGSLRSEIVFIVYIKLRREGLVSLVIAGISETCKLLIPRVLVLSALGWNVSF